MQQHHPILELFGRNVQKFRTEQNISQEKLAEKARLHRTYITEILLMLLLRL